LVSKLRKWFVLPKALKLRVQLLPDGMDIPKTGILPRPDLAFVCQSKLHGGDDGLSSALVYYSKKLASERR
jgi:hypothetical protein